MSLTLHHIDGLPPGLVDCPPEALEARLGGPTLLHLPGERAPGERAPGGRAPGERRDALFVSVLLHGNETSGWQGLCRYLAANATLPRPMTIFIGNVAAAAKGVRTLPSQPDFNRIWGGAGKQDSSAHDLVRGMNDAVASRPLFAAIDLHNNTGHNPHYAVLTDLAQHNLSLAQLFSDQAVYLREPSTVLARIFTDLCPVVTVELGPIADPRCALRAFDFIERCMELDELPQGRTEALNLYRARARVHVRDDIEFSFAGEDEAAPLVLTGGIEAVNFHTLSRGTEFGVTSTPLHQALSVFDDDHNDVLDEFFELRDGHILLKQEVTPSMYTTDPAVIRQDCLCYLMEPLRA